MERRLAKLRSGTPSNSGDSGRVVAVGDHWGDAIVGDPVVDPVEEVVMGDSLGEAFAGDPVGFNGGGTITSSAPFAFGLSTIQTAPSTSFGAAFSFGTGAPSLFAHALAAPPAKPPPLSATIFRFWAGSTTTAFGALAPAAFGSTSTGFRRISQPTATKQALTTPVMTFAFGAGLTPASPTTARFVGGTGAPSFGSGTTPQQARFQEDIHGIWTHTTNNNNNNEGILSIKEVMHPTKGVKDKWRILVTRAQDDCRHIRQQIFESNFAFITMCAAFLLMMSINVLALRLMRMFQEAHRLFNKMAPDDIPRESQYPLDELNYFTLYNASHERQAHWVLTMQAVW